MHKYYDPKTVKSPRDKIKSVQVIFDGKLNPAYSVAIIDWENNKGIGIRWNINNREWDDSEKKNGNKICIGEPNSRGYPTWFMLPDDFLNQLTSCEKNSELKESLKKSLEILNHK